MDLAAVAKGVEAFENGQKWHRRQKWPFLNSREPFQEPFKANPAASLVSNGVEESIDSFGACGITISIHNKHGNICNGGVGVH